MIAGVVIVGGGLAGGLLALALRERGMAVTLVDDPAGASATEISYGAVPGWPQAGAAARRWRRLQARHGLLGWRPARLGRLRGWLPLPLSQVDTAVLAECLPQRLAAAGVECHGGWVERLQPGPAQAGGAPWRLWLRDGRCLEAGQVVLAAGARCRQLWPDLPERLRSSWAAVLELPALPALAADQAGSGPPALWLPLSFSRPGLERRAAGLRQPEWLVDGGLVPRGSGALLGQHSLVRPGLDLGEPPAAAVVEQQLRQALAAKPWTLPLAQLPGRLRQAPVAFCSDGLPLVGAVPEVAGLWLFTGFTAAFTQVPLLAPLLAAVLAAEPGPAAAAQRQLQRLGVGWGDQRAGRGGADRVS